MTDNIARVKLAANGIQQLPCSKKDEGRCYTIAHKALFTPSIHSKNDPTGSDHHETRGKIKLSTTCLCLAIDLHFKWAVAYRTDKILLLVSFLGNGQSFQPCLTLSRSNRTEPSASANLFFRLTSQPYCNGNWRSSVPLFGFNRLARWVISHVAWTRAALFQALSTCRFR